jgi:hypothetical protein
MSKPKLGTGARFASLSRKIEAEGKTPEQAHAIAAAIGRKKYGEHRMNVLAHHGMKKGK